MPVKPSPTGGWDINLSVDRERVHRRLPPGTPKSAAEQLEAEIRVSLAKRAPAVPGNPALTEVMGGYLAHAKTLRSPKTATYHALRIGRWCIGYRAADARQVAARAAADMRGHYAPATINRSLGALKAGLRLAFEQGRTAVNYSDHVKRLPENNMRDRVLTMEQVRKIADHASESTRAAIWIALYTGCRRGELLALRKEDIGADTLMVRAGSTKTLKTRIIPIVSPLRPWLKFVPLAVNAEGLKSGFRRAREAAGMSDVTFHDLRRSCATLMLQAGVDLHVVSKLLGHSTVTVTAQRYAHLQVAQVAAGLERTFGAQPDAHRKKKRPRKAA
jgi:integrase